MIKELTVLSDIWGAKDTQWFDHIRSIVSDKVPIEFCDSSELGKVEVRGHSEQEIHQQFLEFGIDNAVNELLLREQRTKISRIYIGCSIGGLIAWKAALKGLKVDCLITISSTRLRYETQKPACKVVNYFGLSDIYRPQADWLNKQDNLTTKLLTGGHEIYKNHSTLNKIFDDLKLSS